MGIKVRINNNNDLMKVQEKVYENGGIWVDGTKEVLTLEELLKEVNGVEGLCIDLDYFMASKNEEVDICLTVFEAPYEFDFSDCEEYSLDEFLAIDNLRETLEKN